jgi:hypothetical protein
MSEINELFVLAARKKYRFESNKGLLTFEDLFDLPLTALDTIAIKLDEKATAAGRKSFVAKRSVTDTETLNKLEIVKYVIETKQTEAEVAKQKADKASQREFLNELLQKKKLAQLEGMTFEEIQKQLDALA